MALACSNGQALDCSASARKSLGLMLGSITDIKKGLRAAENSDFRAECKRTVVVIPGLVLRTILERQFNDLGIPGSRFARPGMTIDGQNGLTEKYRSHRSV